MEKYVDLHVHTLASDGSYTPEQLVDEALSQGLSAIAVTDHDAIDSVGPVMEVGAGKGLEVIPGVELTAEHKDAEMHMLGFLIDWKDSAFKKKLDFLCDVRVERMRKMVKKLNKMNVDISYDEVLAKVGGKSVGRLHLASVLYERGFVSSIKEAFNKYIGDGKPCCVKKHRLMPKEAIGLIESVRGIPVLAHPFHIGDDDVIPELIKVGLKGIEVYHSDQDEQITKYYEYIAKQNNLLITGGSDCHGDVKGHVMIGNVKLPYQYLEKLKRVKDEIDNS